MTTELKHICIISPSLKMGGIERALTVLANHFAKTGLRITFISCLAGLRFYDLHPTVQIFEPTFQRATGKFNAVLFYPRLIWFIRKSVIKANPNSVLVFGDWFSPLVLLALFGTKYPVFISDRTSPDYKFKFPIPQLKKWLYPKSAGFIAQSKRAADYKQNQFGDKLNIRIIPNAIREVKLHPDILRENIILYVGRFAWEKKPDILIKAFASVANRQGWRLVMAGSGPLLNEMKTLANELNIDGEILFPGKVDDVDSLFAKASIYVLPSVIEGFPNSLCEAMAAGLPVICFESIPHEEILISKKDGLVIKDGDIQDLSSQLKAFMHNKAERDRLGNNAILIKERLNVYTIGNQVLEFINTK